MAIIIHRCTICTHPDLFHTDREDPNTEPCSYGACRAGQHTFGAPEVIPTWSSTATGGSVPDPVVAAPGSLLPGLPRLCDCGACHELYARENRVSA